MKYCLILLVSVLAFTLTGVSLNSLSPKKPVPVRLHPFVKNALKTKGYLAKDSFFKGLKETIEDRDKISLSDDDVFNIIMIIKKLNNTAGVHSSQIKDVVLELNQYLEKFDSNKSMVGKIQLEELLLPVIDEAGKKHYVPIVFVYLGNKSALVFYLIPDKESEALVETGTADIDLDRVIPVDDFGVNNIKVVLLTSRDRLIAQALKEGIIEQTVNNPSRKLVTSQTLQKAYDVLSSKEPYYWKKEIFKLLNLPIPKYLSEKDGWKTFLHDVLIKSNSLITNKKYTQFGLDAMKIKIYTVRVPSEHDGFVYEDGATRLVYPHLSLKKSKHGYSQGELELYLPEFIVDKKKDKGIFYQYNMGNVPTEVLLAQMIDRALAVEIFGLPDYWMAVETIRLNFNDFVAISEVMLYKICCAKEVNDNKFIKRFNDEYASVKTPNARMKYMIELMNDEVNFLWDKKLMFPTTSVSKRSWDKVLTKKECIELSSIPLMKDIKKLMSTQNKDENQITDTASQIMLEIFDRIENEFIDKKLLSEIRMYARKSFIAVKKKKYSTAVYFWGKLRNRESWLKSGNNMEVEIRDKVRNSKNFMLLDLLGNFLDYHYAQYIEIHGVASLESIVGKNYMVDGQIRLIRNDKEFKKVYSDLKPWEIIVLQYIPVLYEEIANVGGIITGNVGAIQSHEATLAREMGIPAASIYHAPKLLERLDRKWVTFTVFGDTASIEPFIDERRIEAAMNVPPSDTERKIEIPCVYVSSLVNYVNGLEQIDSFEEVGNKAYKLAVLKRKLDLPKVSVPDADAVLFSAYHRFLKENPELKKYIEDTVVGIETKNEDEMMRKLQKIRQKIIDTPLPEQLREEITKGLKEGVFKDKQPVAVRSSTNAEDLPNMSGAGLYESYLNIKTLDEIIVHIKKVWASLWKRESFMWRKVFGINHFEVYPAVIIQKMVPADLSFVIYTANVRGKKGKKTNQVVIEMVAGMGESLVGDGSQYVGHPAQFIYDKKKDACVSIKLGDRTIKAVPDKKGGLKTVHDDTLNKDRLEKLVGSSLSEFVSRIGRIAVEDELIFEKPQDIEAVYTNKDGIDQFVIVQSRDIVGFDYYPVRDDILIKKYGEMVDNIGKEMLPYLDKMHSTEEFAVIEEVFRYPFLTMEESEFRYRVPILKYIFRYKNIGPKILSRLLWYPMGGHKDYCGWLKEFSPRMLAKLFTLMVVDLNNEEIKKIFKLNAYMITRSIANMGVEKSKKILKDIRAEKLAMIVNEINHYYENFDRIVIKENKVQEVEMRDVIIAMINVMGHNQKARFLSSLEPGSKNWLFQGDEKILIEGSSIEHPELSILILSDNPEECWNILDVIEEKNIHMCVPVDKRIEENISSTSVKRAVKRIDPFIIVLDVSGWKADDPGSGKPVIDFLYWLKRAKLRSQVILIARKGIQIPSSFYDDYGVTEVIEKDDIFLEKVPAAITSIINEIKQSEFYAKVYPRSLQLEIDDHDMRREKFDDRS